MPRLKPQYSGDNSRAFWKRVKRLGADGDVVYALGVVLQNVEEQVIRALDHAERTKKRKGEGAT